MEPSSSARQSGELETLMYGYQRGDSAATAELISRTSSQIYQFFLADARNPAAAEDALQDFWLRIHRARHTFRPGEPLLPWLYAIARRVRVDAYRKSRRVDAHEIRSNVLPEVAAAAQPEPRGAEFSELLESLPAAQREAILLLKGAGLTLEEAARATGSSVGAVKQRAHRGYEKLRRILGATE